jgi:hypothetical protein
VQAEFSIEATARAYEELYAIAPRQSQPPPIEEATRTRLADLPPSEPIGS